MKNKNRYILLVNTIDKVVKINFIAIKKYLKSNFSILRQKEADELIARYEPTLLILDFGNVTFSDSSGIAVVLGRYKKMKELGGQTELSSVPKGIKRIFSLAAVDKLVKIRENV